MSIIVLKISISFIHDEVSVKDLAKLCKFTKLPISELTIKSLNDSIIIGEITNEKFYSGIEDILALLSSLESDYQLLINKKEAGIDILNDISEKSKNIDMSDFR